MWMLKAWRQWVGTSPGAQALFFGSPGDKQKPAEIPPLVCIPCLTPSLGLFALLSLHRARQHRLSILITAEIKFFKVNYSNEIISLSEKAPSQRAKRGALVVRTQGLLWGESQQDLSGLVPSWLSP